MRTHHVYSAKKCDETFELICPKQLQYTQLVNVADGTCGTKSVHKIDRYSIENHKYRELII